MLRRINVTIQDREVEMKFLSDILCLALLTNETTQSLSNCNVYHTERTMINVRLFCILQTAYPALRIRFLFKMMQIGLFYGKISKSMFSCKLKLSTYFLSPDLQRKTNRIFRLLIFSNLHVVLYLIL